VLWLVCAFVHGAKGILENSLGSFHDNPAKPLMLLRNDVLKPLATTWPMPASFFKVRSLHCQGSHSNHSDVFNNGIYVGGDFSTYVAQRSKSSGDVGTFAEVQGVSGRTAAVFCEEVLGCRAIVEEAPGRPWLLQSLSSALGKTRPALLHVPTEWRNVVAATRALPMDVRSTVDQVRLAAWDGAAVVIADMVRDEELEPDWRVKPLFRVSPGDAQALDTAGTCKARSSCAGSQAALYDDVHALQLSQGARTLLVLQGSGVLDAWDLISGDFITRWHVGMGSSGNFTAMCFDGQDLVLARQLRNGPQLLAFSLPSEIKSAMQAEGASAVSSTQQTN